MSCFMWSAAFDRTDLLLPYLFSSRAYHITTQHTDIPLLKHKNIYIYIYTGAKFTAVASIGVVHKGHVHEAMNLLHPYLPQQGQSNSPYSESGALYALGLIHANKGGNGHSTTITYLSEALRNSGGNDVVQHGAALGMGLAAMGTADAELFESLYNALMLDSACGGEGAALAIGMLMCGQSGKSTFCPGLHFYI